MGVSGVIGLSLALAAAVDLGYGLIAIHLVIVNALVHLAHAAVFCGYNRGLATGVILFLSVGAYGLWRIQQTGTDTQGMHAPGLLSAVAIHAAIVVYAVSRRGFDARL